MISFENDYICGAHPKVMERLLEINLEPATGYGYDKYSISAKEKIKDAIGCPDAEICFLVGGTQTNQVVCDALLKSYEGVIAPTTGHVSVHEAGAIEHGGHKVIQLEANDGKINAGQLKSCLESFYEDETHEHMVFPGMVYITFPTESGSLYKKNELEDIYSVCKNYEIPLYIDGARLAYGLMSDECDVTMKELANLCDVFYIGGTKDGAMFGEAVVFRGVAMPKHFDAFIKQRGALLAKGKLLGIQFDTLFTDNLYFEIGRHANRLAKLMVDIFEEKGYKIAFDSPTNQQFVLVEDDKLKELEKKVAFSFWEKADSNHTVIRFVTSWSTTEEDVLSLRDIL
ncbi:MAG: aminotransferase class I/II-fold pyridoxal phosphate-dependent enzyme [Lachnospiraceae bacterium]|nr:aminotransferase class I/II-fold pyridoxal phosphate-dependent enzyme [Lachnospiraceae bacterium]